MNNKVSLSHRFSRFIVEYRWVFTIIFIALAVFSAIMIPQTKIIYDLSTYTPEGGMTQQSIALMREEFDDKGSLTVMYADVTLEDAEIILDELKDIEGVSNVVFNADTDYKKSDALFNIILNDYDSTDNANATIERVFKYSLDKDTYFGGQSATSYLTRKNTEKEVLSVGIIIVVLVLAILLFTSRTYFELVVMLLVFGTATIINYGTNFLLGEISYISNFISIILQLVLTLDYSVILLHRFIEERETRSPKEASAATLGKGIPEILSSSLTTIAGVCALILMALPIGREIGISLTKGILLSIVTVIFLMPALLVFFSKPIEKTKHRPFLPNVTNFARKTLSARKVIIPAFIVIVSLACVGQFFNTYYFDINGSADIVSQKERIAQTFGTTNTLVVIVPNTDTEKEDALTEHVLSKTIINQALSLNRIELLGMDIRLKDKMNYIELAQTFEDIDMSSFSWITGISNKSEEQLMLDIIKDYINKKDPNSPIPIEEYKISLANLLVYIYDTYPILQSVEQIEQFALAVDNFESENYTRIMFNINGAVEGENTFQLIEELTNELGLFYGEDNFYLAGESVMNYEMARAFPDDNIKVLLFTSMFILLILLLTFRNLLLPLIMMLTIQGGIWINFAIQFLMGNSILFISYLVINAIQMGATIDYAIILTNRFQTTKNNFTDLKDAIAESLNSIFPTIATSGTILTGTGFIMGLATSEPAISSLGMLLGIGTFLSMVMVLLVLPQLLFVLNKWIDKSQIRLPKKKSSNDTVAKELINC